MDFQTAQKIIQLTQNSYDIIADSFAQSRYHTWIEVDQIINNYIQDGQKVLDLGCGHGRLLKSLANKKISYTGLDSSNELIKQCQKIYPKNKFIIGDLLNLTQFNNQSFDVVFMIASFNHIPSRELQLKVLANINRLLKQQGLLIMTNWNLWQINHKKNVWSSKFNHNYQLSNSTYRFKFNELLTLWQNKHPLFYQAFTPRYLKKILKKTNFKIIKNKFVTENKNAHWWNGRNILTIAQKH